VTGAGEAVEEFKEFKEFELGDSGDAELFERRSAALWSR
jgi:hypothetical protein